MKKQDIRNAYTQKVTELLNQGYTIFPDTMNGSQGEIAHIDLTNGSEIIRVLLERGLCWSHISDGFHGDVVTLTVGRAAADTWVGDRWDGTIWNSRLEPSFQIKWAEVNGEQPTGAQLPNQVGRGQRSRRGLVPRARRSRQHRAHPDGALPRQPH